MKPEESPFIFFIWQRETGGQFMKDTLAVGPRVLSALDTSECIGNYESESKSRSLEKKSWGKRRGKEPEEENNNTAEDSNQGGVINVRDIESFEGRKCIPEPEIQEKMDSGYSNCSCSHIVIYNREQLDPAKESGSYAANDGGTRFF
jgi:hypothetical protein